MRSINLKNWIILFIFFELKLLKDLGYDPKLSKSNIKNTDSEIKKIKIDTYTYDVPDFLIKEKVPQKISNLLIKKSLYFTRNLIQNKFYLPNNLFLPKSRILFENCFS